MILAGFPNPIGWAVDQVKGFVGDAATAGFEVLIGGLTAWVLDAVMWVIGGVFTFFLDATDPNVQADWFVAGDGPYATTATIGASLLVGFVLAGIVQGVLAGDVGGMLRQIGLQFPVAVLGMVGLVTITQALVAVTDALSRAVLERFEDDVAGLTTVIGSLSALSGGSATAFVVFLLGLIAVIAGLILVAELVVRSVLIYIVVALAPLVFAAQIWPAMRGAGRRLLELLVALIVSKLVIAVALAVAAAAIVGTGSGGEVTALPEPEVVAEDPGGSVTHAVGILLAAVAAFGVAAFSPLLVVKLMPITEAALVAQGVKGGPVRSGQTAMSMGYYAQSRTSQRMKGVAAGPPGAQGMPGAMPPVVAGASSPLAGGAAAAVGGVAAVGAATRAVGRGATAATQVTEQPNRATPPQVRRPSKDPETTRDS